MSSYDHMTRGVTGAAQRTVTRRGLFKGAGLAALATAAASTLSGCGEGQQVEAPAKNLTTQRPAAPAWLGEPPAVDEADITETINVDVVVVGCGTGGIPAIISAAENGARVLGIDQQETVSNVREDIGAIDSALQRETEKTFPEFHIDKMEALEDIVRYANGFVDYDLVNLWANESGAMVDWLTGDGIKAAMWCGADIDPIGCAVTFNRAACKPDETAGSDVKGQWWWFGEQPFLKVNLNGKRFCNESGPYDYMLLSAFMQPYHTYVDIFDSNYAAHVTQMNEVGCLPRPLCLPRWGAAGRRSCAA